MLKQYYLLALVLCLNLNGYCQKKVLKDSTAVAGTADRFMKKVSEKEVAEAFSSFRHYSRLPDKEVDRLISQLKGQLISYREDYGEIIDFQFIGGRYVGEYLYERSYLLRFEEHPIRFHLIHYHNGKGWIISYLRWKDGIKQLFGH